jgi:hypothetical protein
MSELPLKQMVKDAEWILDGKARQNIVIDVANHVLALAAEVERLEKIADEIERLKSALREATP